MLLSHNEFPVLKDVKIKSKKAYTYFIISKFVRKRPQGEKKKRKRSEIRELSWEA